MGILSRTYNEPAFWDGKAERRIFIKQAADGWWQAWWMRGYSGENKHNLIRSIPATAEILHIVSEIRKLAKKKGWVEMKRCPKCHLLHHSGKAICHICDLKKRSGNGS